MSNAPPGPKRTHSQPEQARRMRRAKQRASDETVRVATHRRFALEFQLYGFLVVLVPSLAAVPFRADVAEQIDKWEEIGQGNERGGGSTTTVP